MYYLYINTASGTFVVVSADEPEPVPAYHSYYGTFGTRALAEATGILETTETCVAFYANHASGETRIVVDPSGNWRGSQEHPLSLVEFTYDPKAPDESPWSFKSQMAKATEAAQFHSSLAS